MKILIALLCVAAAVASPAIPYSEEYVDFIQDEVFLAGGGDSQQSFDSQSVESSEVALAGDDWRQAALDRVNELRVAGGQKPLTLDPKFSKSAQDWADKTKCAGGVHSPSIPNQAENLAGLLKSSMTQSEMAVDGVNRWHSEIGKYDCRSFGFSGRADSAYYLEIGHYHNMMNKMFSVVGFGMAMCPSGEKGQLVAHFAGPDGYAQKAFSDELASQGLGFSNYLSVDRSAFVNCPNSA